MKTNYDEDNIRVVTACEAVRLRPNAYFTECFETKSLNTLPLEATCHAIDEVVDGNCSWITFKIGKMHFSIVYDSAMSLSLKNDGVTKAEAIMSQIYACKNEKKHLHVGADFCRVGLASLNFVSNRCTLTTVENDQKAFFEFEDGILINKSFNSTDEDEFTELSFAFDDSIFPNIEFDLDGVQESLSRIKTAFPNVKVEVLSQFN
ncbi:MAG: DNA gyrase/topoisomerase IV subunit B [Crocinitomicaceae bacterium]|jgi:DNA gyrase/topoisomerase IV subunit B